jgi:hypothetical protein
MLNRQLRTVDKWWSSVLGVGAGHRQSLTAVETSSLNEVSPRPSELNGVFKEQKKKEQSLKLEHQESLIEVGRREAETSKLNLMRMYRSGGTRTSNQQTIIMFWCVFHRW